MASPNSLKRTFQDADFQNSHSDTIETFGGSDKIVPRQQAENPQLRNDLLFYPLLPSKPVNSFPADDAIPTVKTSPKPATNSKRRKLTSEEQEARRLEKEAKARQRADEKAKFEEIRWVKEVEREERRKDKETQTRQREEERRKKEEEKTKKDKSQLRLNSFFGQPPVAYERPTTTAEQESRSPCGRGRNATSSAINIRIKSRSRSVPRAPLKAQTSEYERLFPPFFVQSHTNIAPQSQFSRDRDSLKYAQSRIDEGFGSGSGTDIGHSAPVFDPIKLFHLSSNRRSGIHHHHRFSVKEIVGRIHGTAQIQIDLTESGTENVSRNPTALLNCFTVKYLKFAEDVRPPYIGTYSKISDQSEGSKLCRNPFTKILPATDYGYDSEAEWEDPGEGEDLDSEGEEEAGEDEDEDEMEGFLDDEEGSEMVRAANLKHRALNGDLEPLCTGLCWENAPDQGGLSSVEMKLTVDMRSLRLEILSDSFHLPIDPYSTLYWQPASTHHSNPLQSSMDPPRLPLTTINRTNTLLPNSNANVDEKPQAGQDVDPSTLATSKIPKRLIAPELMTAFAAAVQGSDLTKAGLIEILKKQFPKQTKDAIKDTLNLVAERVGSKEADKRWVIKEGDFFVTSPEV